MPQKVVIIHPLLKSGSFELRPLESVLDEARGLAEAIDLDILACLPVNVPTPHAATLLSKGGVEKAAAEIEATQPHVVFVNAHLSPVQQRNLEKAWQAKVIDRTGLILEIFGARANTREGRLQVELAALSYQRSRLVRSWTHLERQRATGKTGGPGETQIELDRRLINDRMGQIRKQIEQVRTTRDLQRKARERVPFPLVAIVGYTNAGKSTLFNRLTGAEVLVKDMLFATLDTTMRAVALPGGQNIILSDTVGFITDLPTALVTAFRATLEQVTQADLILHVQDISDPDYAARRADVLGILEDLGVPPDAAHVMDVYNKIDGLDAGARTALKRRTKRVPMQAAVSAITQDGLDDLIAKIKAWLDRGREMFVVTLPQGDGRSLAWLHAHGEVLKETYEEDVTHVSVRMTQAHYDQFMHQKAHKTN